MVKLGVSFHFVHCCEIKTMKHYLLDCPRYVVSRSKMLGNLSKLGLNEGDITWSILLSGGSFSSNKKRIILALFTYFNDTDKFFCNFYILGLLIYYELYLEGFTDYLVLVAFL